MAFPSFDSWPTLCAQTIKEKTAPLTFVEQGSLDLTDQRNDSECAIHSHLLAAGPLRVDGAMMRYRSVTNLAKAAALRLRF